MSNIHKIVLRAIPIISSLILSSHYIYPATEKKLDQKIINITPQMSNQLTQILENAKPYQSFHFQRGDYLIKKGLTIHHKSFLKLEAEKDVFIILDNMQDAVLWILNSDNIDISGFHIRHRMPVSKKEVCVGSVVFIHASHDIILNHLELNGSGTEGVFLYNSMSVMIKNSWIHNNTKTGIFFNKFVDHIFIENNTFENNPLNISGNLYEKNEWKKYVHLKNNKFDKNPVDQ